jgi:hypothetical protein
VTMDPGLYPSFVAMDGRSWSPGRLLECAEVAEGLEFRALATNDHRRQLEEHLRAAGKELNRFPNATRGPPLYKLRKTV